MGVPALPPLPDSRPSLYLGQVATRCVIPNATAATSKSINFMSYHFARDDITSIAVEDANKYGSSASAYEINPGATPTYTRYIQYPIGSNWQRFSYGGASSYTFADGEIKLSDLLTLATKIPSGAMFLMAVHVESANGVVVYNFSNQNFTTASNNNTAVTNQRWDASGSLAGRSDIFNGASTLITANSGSVQNAIMPSALVSYTRRSSVLIVDCSRGFGTADFLGIYPASPGFVDGSGDVGVIARSVGASLPYINASISGDKIENWLTAHSMRSGRAQYCSHIIGYDPINSINGGRTAAQIIADLTSMCAISDFAGKPKFLVTCYPQPDATNTTPNTNDAVRIAVSNAIRSGQIVGASGFFDLDLLFSSALNSGLFKTVDGQAISDDYTHLNQKGHLYGMRSGVVDPSRLVR